MPTQRLLFPALIILFNLIKIAHADTLYLKNGRSLEGLIKSQSEDTVELEIYAGSVKFSSGAIERIERSTPQEAEAIRKKWVKEKKDALERIARQKLEDDAKPKKAGFYQNTEGITLKVTLNKKIKASLVLDTGATMVTLRRNTAKRLGINLDKAKPDGKMILADGRQVDAKLMILESVKVEDIEEENVEAVIIMDEVETPGAEDGLLGMSFLKRFNFKVDQKEKKLILEKL